MYHRPSRGSLLDRFWFKITFTAHCATKVWFFRTRPYLTINVIKPIQFPHIKRVVKIEKIVIDGAVHACRFPHSLWEVCTLDGAFSLRQLSYYVRTRFNCAVRGDMLITECIGCLSFAVLGLLFWSVTAILGAR